MDWWILILSFFAVVLGIYYFIFQKIGRLEEMGIIHKRPLPIFGNVAAAIFQKYAMFEVLNRLYKLNENADYVGFYDFSEPVIMLRSPELIKNVTIKNFDYFVDHRGFVDPVMDPLFGINLFSLRGDKWREARNLLSPAFTGSKLKAMFQLMSICAKKFTDFLAEQSLDKNNDINSKDAFTRYTTDVIATCAFGISVDSMRNQNNDFYTLGRRAINFEGILSLKFLLLRSFPNIAKFFNIKLIDTRIERFFEGVLKETIETRDREGITRPDMLQLMLDARGKKTGYCSELTLQAMTAQAFVFFFGGFDTSSSFMCFVSHILAVNPEIQKRVQNEVDNVMKATNGEPTYEAINGMKYLDAIFSETLRMYPILTFLDRICTKTFELPPALPGGKPVILEPGQNLLIPVYAIHHDPKYFDNPDEFNAERFLGSRKNDIDQSTYFPFGLGPRICTGPKFALLQSKVVIFHLLSKCNLKPSPKTPVPLELSKSSLTLSAGSGFRFHLESRAAEKGFTETL